MPEVLSYALNTGAVPPPAWADWAIPDVPGAGDRGFRRLAGTEAGRAYANLHALYCGQRRFDEAERCFAEGVAYCDEHDIGASQLSACG